MLQVLDIDGMQPEPSPAVTRLKAEARALQQSETGRRNTPTPIDLKALQDCDRVADSPEPESGSSPRLHTSGSPLGPGFEVQRPGDAPRQNGDSNIPVRLQIRTSGSQRESMPPPRSIPRPPSIGSGQSQDRSQRGTQPDEEGLFRLKRSSRAPTQVYP